MENKEMKSNTHFHVRWYLASDNCPRIARKLIIKFTPM